MSKKDLGSHHRLAMCDSIQNFVHISFPYQVQNNEIDCTFFDAVIY